MPDNEPYLGRATVLQFDQTILTVLKLNQSTAQRTHGLQLSDMQQMACVVIPQSVSLALSIRELVRQGYLFGAHMLVRPLVERTAILLYLQAVPSDIAKWKRGWHAGDAPGLSKMLEAIQKVKGRAEFAKGADLTASFNALMHGKPDSALWNTILLDNGKPGYASSKILDRPDLCDDVCAQTLTWLVVVMAMMLAYFPDAEPANSSSQATPTSGRT
ncbi:MAG: hypothetical protein OEV08_08690 [Nitrospira sp.]|nr:hypothetical protein [Nitrospira sp.]